MAAARAEPPSRSGAAFSARRLLLGGTSAWYVPTHFEPIKKVSMNSHSEVVTFFDTEARSVVSVRKVREALRSMGDAQRLLRELKVLRFAGHENLLTVVDAYAPSGLNDVYVVTEAMKSNLQRVINSRQDLELEHRQFFLHQILRGLFYLHSAGLTHGDLRPSNILVNADCSLKICNFGLARRREEEDGAVLCEYRAPELLIGGRYTSSVDIWAAGCILGELASGARVFGGRDNLDQMRRIVLVLGRMPAEEFDWIQSGNRDLLQITARSELPVSWEDRIPGCPGDELQAIGSMLVFGPQRRPTAQQMLRHPYLQSLYSEAGDEVRADSEFDWFFERCPLSKDEIRGHFLDQCRTFCHSHLAPGTHILTPKQQDRLPEHATERGFSKVSSPCNYNGGHVSTPCHRDVDDDEQASEESYGYMSDGGDASPPCHRGVDDDEQASQESYGYMSDGGDASPPCHQDVDDDEQASEESYGYMSESSTNEADLTNTKEVSPKFGATLAVPWYYCLASA